MICPSTDLDCDNPGCRRGGCQGRLPQLPLFQLREPKPVSPAGDPVGELTVGLAERHLVVA